MVVGSGSSSGSTRSSGSSSGSSSGVVVVVVVEVVVVVVVLVVAGVQKICLLFELCLCAVIIFNVQRYVYMTVLSGLVTDFVCVPIWEFLICYWLGALPRQGLQKTIVYKANCY